MNNKRTLEEDTENAIEQENLKKVKHSTIIQCPNELKNNGFCFNKNDPEHCKNFYHYSRTLRNTYIYNHEGKCICKFKFSKCFQRFNPDHLRLYTHI